jgi:hypothetical protein
MCLVDLKSQETLSTLHFLSSDGEEYEIRLGSRRNGCNRHISVVAVYCYDFATINAGDEEFPLIIRRWVPIPTADGKYFYRREDAEKYAKELKETIEGRGFIRFLKSFIK